jgi:hypothetical protein
MSWARPGALARDPANKQFKDVDLGPSRTSPSRAPVKLHSRARRDIQQRSIDHDTSDGPYHYRL